MDTTAWSAYNSARGKKKARLLASLVEAEAPLARWFAQKFLARINADASVFSDDVYQAALIGVLRAIRSWEPLRGRFSTLAGNWARLEMQRVMGHAAPVSYPRSLLFDGGFQHEAAVFYAQYGRDPTPDELNVPARKRLAHGRVPAKFVSLAKAEQEVAEEPRDEAEELAAEREHDSKLTALQAYLCKLTKSERAAVLAGKRPDLMTAAREYIEGTA